MTPWLPNLAMFCRGTPEDVNKTKEVLRLLIDLTVARTDVSTLSYTTGFGIAAYMSY